MFRISPIAMGVRIDAVSVSSKSSSEPALTERAAISKTLAAAV